MGRSIAFVLAVVGLVIGLALLDRNREPEAIGATLAPVADREVDTSESSDALGLGDTAYLTSCLSSALAGAGGDVPPAPPLTPRGVQVISERVARLRELSFDGPVEVDFLTDDGIDRRVSGLIDAEVSPELTARQGLVLELLGALPPGSDLLELTRAALAAQVVGLFVPETEELLVASSGDAGAVEEITLAHELEHALAFDALGLPIARRYRPERSDRDLAAQALVEGDATLTMELYALRYVELSEQLALLNEPGAASSEEELAKLPYILQQQLLFPYEAGLEFVCDRYTDGGWEAVDRAYGDPPRSTAELLDPSAGPVRVVDPRSPGSLPEPWRRTISGQLGAADLTWLFEAPGGDPDLALPEPEAAALDWRGGRYELWQDGSRSALAVTLSERAGGALCGATLAWYGASFPDSALAKAAKGTTTFEEPGRSAAIACEAGAVVIGIGPDPAAAAALAG